MREALSILAGLIAFGGYIPYTIDILKGRVKPARSARLMFAILLVVTLLQQKQLGSGWLLAITYGEVIGTIAILALSFTRGVGGLSKIDLVCYVLLTVDVVLWLATGQALLALILSVIADLIAFSPTLIKTWRQPWTETPLFFFTMVIASPLNIIAAGTYSFGVLLFPVYLAVANLVEVVLILWRQAVVPHPSKVRNLERQPIN